MLKKLNCELFLVFLLVSSCCSEPLSAGTGKAPINPYDVCVKYIQQKNYSKALSIASKYYKSKRPGYHETGRALIARIYREKGNLKKARGLLAKFDSLPTAFDQVTAPCYLEMARIKIVDKDYHSALKILNVLGKNQEGIARAECAEEISGVFIKMKEFRKALEWIDYAIACVRQIYPSEIDDATKQYLQRLGEKRQYIVNILDIIELGLGCVLFGEADATRLRTNYASAAQKYSDIVEKELANRENVGLLDELLEADIFDEKRLQELPISPIYAETSKIYKSLCLAESGKENVAAKALLNFISEQEFGLYRGEAYRILGDICLEKRYDAKAAHSYYTKAIEWLDVIAQKDAFIEEFQVPGKAATKTAPPPEMKKTDVWGNVKWSLPGAGKIFNRQTCSWYLDYQKQMAQTKRALCNFMLGKKEEAISDLQVILDTDSHERNMEATGMPNSYARLVTEFREGRMFATKEELAHFKGRSKVAIILADYYYEIEQWHEAAKRYRNINATFRKKLDISAKAYLDLMLSFCARIVDRDEEKALSLLSRFDTQYRNTPSWPRAMLARFHIYQNYDEKRDLAINTLVNLHKRLPNHELGEYAYYHLGEYYFAVGEHGMATNVFNDTIKRHKDNWMARGAQQYLDLIQEKGGDK